VNTGSSFDTTGRLTAATSFAATSGLVNGIPTPDSNRSLASASLSTGTLRASVNNVAAGGFTLQGVVLAQMHDIVTLNVAGANDQTRTRITVQYTVDGSFASAGVLPPGNVPQAYVQTLLQLNNPNSAQASLTARAVTQWYPSDPNTLVPTLIGANESFTNAGSAFNTGDVNGAGSWAGSSATLMTFTGSFDIIGRSVTLNPAFTLDVNCTYATCDFSNTARFNFVNLPSSVSFTSDAGVFLSAVPEPQTYALMLAGLVAMGGFVRRQRATAGAVPV